MEQQRDCRPNADRRVRWPNDLSEKLKELWNQNLSAWRIAEHLGGGLTRNAVIGKARRMGMPSHKPVERKPMKVLHPSPRARRSRQRAVTKGTEGMETTKPKFIGRRLEQLGPNDCRYAYGDRAPFVFCAAPVQFGSSFCPACHARVFISTRGQARVMRFTPTWGNAP